MAIPRLLLFGSPGAGKTALLGALAQAAATPGSALKGQLADPAGAWSKLRETTYHADAPATDKLAIHDFKLQPAEGTAGGAEVKIVDCSGKSAAQMLKANSPFADAHPLRKPVFAADTILLLLDITQPGKKLSDEFRQLGRWLDALMQARGRRTDIGDLPVYLVLTKCDALGTKDDTASHWKQKLDDAKKKVDAQFRKVLKDEGEGFGSIELKLWATAIKRPAFADRPAGPEEPYGVAELFRECVQSAGDFARRRQGSQSRLLNLVVGLAGLVALLALALAFLFEYQPDTRFAALDEQVHALLPRADANAAQRLASTLKRLQEKEQRLADLESDPGFAHLPAESRDRVRQYRQEIEQYLKLAQDVRTSVKFPLLAKSEAEYKAQEKYLIALAPPPAWNDTPIGKRVQQCRREYEAVDKALKERQAWYAEETKKNNQLLDQGTELQLKVRRKAKLQPQEVERWDVQYRAQMRARPAALQSDPIPGVTGVSYDFLDQFRAIKDARKRADAVKTQLKRVADNIQDELKGT